MKDNILFKGMMPAIFSVYDNNLDVIDSTVEKLVNYQLDGGSTGFYVAGGTGECNVLPAKTRKQMLESVVEHNKGRGKVIAHIGATHFDETMELLKHANSLKIDGVASLPPTLGPYYRAPEILSYYQTLAKEAKSPLIAYIRPDLNCDIVWFAQELMKMDNVAGVKLTIPNYFQQCNVMQVNNGNINVLNGPDETAICGLAMGCHGAIGTTYNIVPRLSANIYKYYMQGDMEKAKGYQHYLNKIINICLGHNIDYWKEVLRLLGFDMGTIIYPGKPVTKEESAELKKKLEEINFFELYDKDFI